MQKETDVFAKIKAARERLQSKKNQPEAVQPSSEPENPLLKYYNPSKQQTPEQPINQPPIFSNPSQIPTPQTGRQGFSPLLKDMPTPPSPVPMPGTVGGTLDQFMPELPKGINPTETPSYSANGQSLTREQTAQTIKQSESTKNLGNLGVMNDPELERIKNSKILEAYNAPKPAAQAQKPKIDKAWYEDFVDGIHPSWEKVKSLGAKGISEAADLTLAANSGSGGVTPYLAKAMNYLEQKRLQASGIDNGIGAGLREYAADRDKEADELNETRDTESWGYKIGSVVPYTAGILAAVVTKPISAPVAGAIGLANVVGLSAVSFGSGIETYDEYKKDKGQESDPLARLGMGALYGSLEFGMERFALSKFIPASVQAKLSKSVIDVMGAGPVVEKTAKDLITDFANSSQSRATLVEGVLKSAGRGFVIEGSTEGATTFGQEFSNYLFQERKDWKKPIEILKESGEAFVLGGVMGVAIGPVSFAANRIENQQRRSAAETLVFAEMADNSGAVEIVGPAKSKPKTGQQATPSGSVEGTIGQEMFYNAIRANGTTTTVSENDINRVFQIKPETFTELLKGKYQGQALQENRANEAATQSANQESDTIRGEYQAMTFQGQDGVQMISAAQFNGEKVFVTAMFPDGNAVIQKPGEEKKVVSSLGLSEQETMPFDQFIETFGPVPEQTQVFDPANPIQIGEKIPIDGQEFSVSSVNLEEGIVQLENEDGTIFETIPVADFQQFRQPQQAEAAPQANEGAEKLRGMFTPKEDITPKPQQDEKISEERPVLEGLPGNRDEGQRGQEGAELRTQEGNKEEVIQNNPPTGAQESTVDNTIAADYLLTGGIGTILSTDYLLKGISGVFSKADKKITEIRNRYAKELAEKNLVDIKNLIGTETYNRMISEIREVIGQDYNGSEEIQSILDEVLKFPTGMPQRIGNQIESRLDRFENSQNEPATGAITPQSPDAPLQPAKPVTGSAQQPTPKNVPEKPVGQGADGAVQVRFPTHKVNVGQNLINNENVDKNGFVYFNSEKEAIDFANEVQKKTGDFLNVEKSDPIESILNDNPFLIGVKKEDSTEKLEKVKKELESDLGKYKEEDQGVFEELKDAITAIDLIISNRKNQPQPNEPPVQEPAKPNKTGKLPYASNVKLISKKETEIGTEYKFRQETNIGIETKVVYSDNPDIVLPKSFQTAEDFIKFKEDAINFKKSNQAPPKAPRKPIERPSNYGKSNKLVTEKEVEDAKKKLQDFFKGKGGKLYIGLDSEISAAALKYSAYHLEAGSRKFADFVRVMVEDFGQGIAPYLSGFYEQLKRDPDFKREGISKEMTPTDEVDDFDIDNFVKQLTNNQEDVSDRPGTSEQDQQDGEAPVQGDNESIPSDRGNERDTGTKNEGGGKKGNRKRPGSKGNSGLSSNPSGKGGIIDLFPNESRSDGKKPSTGLVDGRGNSLDSPTGNDAGQTGDNDIDQDTQKQIESFANKTAKRLKLQQAAESIPGKVGDLDNIRETLPFLLPEQQEDVFKAENRFFGPDSSDPKKANGKGYLFTNGTGTGKTYTGLGIVKRFLKEGKKNILIITPSQTKVSDWVKDAKNLGMNATKIKNTKDAGKGVSVTTFATFRANKALYERDFDLIVYDESHRLMEDKNAKESSTTRSHYMNSNTSKNNALKRLKDATGLWAKSKALYDQINSSEKWLTDSPNNLDVAVRLEEARKEQKEVEQEIKRITPVLEKRAAEVVGKTKIVFLSATPFKTIMNLRYANGVLFDWGTETTFIPKSQGMSRVDPEGQFFLDNFGSKYEWKTNQLQLKGKPNLDAISMQEIAFNAKLVQDGVMSGRAIESDMDYRRDFPILTGEKSERFNEALEAIRTKDSGFEALSKAATNTFFNTNYTTQLLESMKATLMIPRMKEHIKMGRKIVMFHRRQQANIEPPFFKIANETMLNAIAILSQEGNDDKTIEKAKLALQQVADFREQYDDLFQWEKGLDYRSAVEQFAEAFGEQIRFQNGKTSKKDKESGVNVTDFNEVGGPVKIIMVQEESGKEGISLHDTSGTEQRVLVSLSMPRSSTTALQIEGRIYRIGVSSNAVYEYPVMGLDFEIMHFASNINTKLSTTENLAMGDGSRDLINSFIAGVQAATDDAPNQEQGIGGKELDKRISEERSQYRKAILYYQSNQKTRGRRDEREGVDFYATPEPVGQKMVEFLGLEPMEKVLEPSVGKGAIAMWFPGSSNRTIIEESMKLFTKASIVASGANSMNMRFEDFNIINKFHGVAMNPPFGSAGKTAMDHVEKAIKHLYDGGRVVALVPVGAMDKRVEAFMESKEAKNIYLRGEILLPGSTFEQAGTKVNTRILIFDKIEKPSDPREVENMGTESIDLRRAKTIEELFEAIEFVEMPSRIEVQDKKQIIDQLAGITEEEDAPKKEKAVKEITEKAEIGDLLYKEGKHTKTGAPLHLVEMTKSLGNYQELKVLAESMDGFYDRYSKAFRFKSKEGADKFIQKGSQGQANPDDVRFSKPSTASDLNRILDGEQKPTKKAQDITDKAAKFTENWNNAPEIVVLNNSKEAMERFPELEQQYSEEDINQVPALFIKDATTGEPKAVLIASHSYLSGKGAVEKAILHEVIGHYGVREFLKQQAKGDRKKYVDSYVAFMQQVFDAKKADPVLADISQRYFGKKPSELSANEQTIIGDEYLAKLAEDGVQDQWIDRAITKFRQILRDLGITLGLSDSEIRAMLGNSRRIVMGPNGSMMVREGIDQTNLPREMIIGEQGARKLDKQEEATIRIDNLGVAREMEAAGLKEKWFIEDFTTVTDIRIEFPSQNEAYDYMALPENKIIEQNGQKAKADKFHTVSVSPEAQIKIATGWEKGADGKWRYEVEDIDFVENIDNRLKASEKARTKNGVDLVEFVNDNKLFKAYPALRWIKVVMDTKSGSYGSFNKLKGDGGFGQITINPDKHQNDKQILSTLLHEIQHAIQQKEGFASGGNINDVALREKLSAAGVKTREELNEKIKTLKSEYKIIYNRWEDRAFAKRYKGQTEESRNLLREWQGINNQIKDLESNTYDFQKAFRLYQRIAGEVESRNVESRANLSLEERRTQTLQSTEDVSREDQIFLENASGPAMSMTQPQTQSAAFKKWFGDSKVVDSNGEPLVVYHGMPDSREFKESYTFKTRNESFFGSDESPAYFFTDSISKAKSYADPKRAFDYQGATEEVVSTYISAVNPLEINARGAEWRKFETEINGEKIKGTRNLVEYAQKNGYDSLIVKNVRDNYNNNENSKPAVVYAVFSPTQIKSATDNSGAFDGENSDIRFMRVGSTEPDFTAINVRNFNEAKLSWFERKVIEPLQDRMIRSKKLIQSKTGGNVSDAADFYTKENLASGKTLEKARVFIKDLWKPLIKTANKIHNDTGLASEDISNYIKFKHHAERKAYFMDEYAQLGKAVPIDDRWPTGMTDEEAADGIAAFETSVDKAMIDQLNQQVRAISHFTSMERYESGMITKETFDDLMTRYENYVPLTDWSGMESTNDKVYTLLMSAKGRTSESADPLPFLFTAAQESIMRGEKNRTKQSVLEFVKENVSPGNYFIRNAFYLNTKMQDENGNDIWIETMNKPTAGQLANGDAIRSFDPAVHRHVQQQGDQVAVLDVMVKGKKVFIEFKDVNYNDPKAAKYGIVPTIKNMNQDQVPGFFEKLRPYTRWLSSMYTQYNPEFGIRNLIRDVGFGTFNILVEQDATIARKTIGKMGKSAITLGKFLKNDEYPAGKDGQMLREFMEEGALTGYTDLQTAAEVFAQTKKEIDKADKEGIWRRGGNAAIKPIQLFGQGLEIYNKTMENSMRFSYYKTLRDEGMSKQQSAAKAKDLTVNFNRKGRSSGVMGTIFIFFNASVQGTERLARSFTNPKTAKKALGYAGGIMAAGMMQSLLLGMLDEEDEDGRSYYEKIPDYVRKNHVILPNLFSDTPGDYIKIPLPYGLNIFYAFGESIGRTMMGKSDIEKEAMGMLGASTNVFSPIGGYDFTSDQNGFQQAMMLASPSVIQPLADLGFNRNFAGSPIYRENFTTNQFKLPDSQMYFEGVNPFIKESTTFMNKISGGNEVVSGKIDINPEWLEYGMEQYLGGPVQFTKNIATTVAEVISGENILEDPFIRKVPFVRSFVQKTGSDFEARASFYENRDKAITAVEAFEKMQEAGLSEDAAKFYDKNKGLIGLSETYKGYERLVKDLNKIIGEMKSADKELYKDDIEKLYEDRTKIMRGFNREYGEVMYKNRPNPIKEILNMK
jgi:hypothetical protein